MTSFTIRGRIDVTKVEEGPGMAIEETIRKELAAAVNAELERREKREKLIRNTIIGGVVGAVALLITLYLVFGFSN